MPFFKFNNVRIAGIAAAVPTQKRLSTDYNDVFGEENVQKFIETTGVASHHEALPDQCASDLSFAAAKELIQRQNLNPDEIGALVFITQSPDYRRPSTACVLQNRLGLSKNCAAIEIQLGCSAYVYGIQVIASLMQNSDIQKALLLCGETTTKIANLKDSSVAMLFGDAGAATLLVKEDTASPILGCLKTDGARFPAIVAPAGGFRMPNPSEEEFVCKDGNKRTLYNLHMDGMNVFSFTITDVPSTFKEFLEHFSLRVEEFDAFCLHQANFLTLKQISRKLKLPWEKVLISMDRYGNTSGVTLPLTLCDAFGEKDGAEQNIFMSGFGTGLSWGVVCAKLDPGVIYPVIQTDITYPEGVFSPGML